MTLRRVVLQRVAVQGASVLREGRLLRVLNRGIEYGSVFSHVVPVTIYRIEAGMRGRQVSDALLHIMYEWGGVTEYSSLSGSGTVFTHFLS